MAVYVDALINYGWKLGPSCHMSADTLEELHLAASKIGMKRSWFQDKGDGFPHYDLVASRRAAAVKNGAIEVTGWKNMSDHIKRIKSIYSQSK